MYTDQSNANMVINLDSSKSLQSQLSRVEAIGKAYQDAQDALSAHLASKETYVQNQAQNLLRIESAALGYERLTLHSALSICHQLRDRPDFTSVEPAGATGLTFTYAPKLTKAKLSELAHQVAEQMFDRDLHELEYKVRLAETKFNQVADQVNKYRDEIQKQKDRQDEIFRMFERS